MKSLPTYHITVSKRANKALNAGPKHIALKLIAWIELVEEKGLEKARENSGYHDEPLKGNRQGQRSIRLSRAYRAIYTVTAQGEICFIDIIEVSKHDY